MQSDIFINIIEESKHIFGFIIKYFKRVSFFHIACVLCIFASLNWNNENNNNEKPHSSYKYFVFNHL